MDSVEVSRGVTQDIDGVVRGAVIDGDGVMQLSPRDRLSPKFLPTVPSHNGE